MNQKPKSIELIRNHDEPPILLDIEPTMRTVTHKGERYHKMPNCVRELDDGTFAGCYLWEGYRAYITAKLKEKESQP